MCIFVNQIEYLIHKQNDFLFLQNFKLFISKFLPQICFTQNTIYCLTQAVYGIRLKWYAIDDQRVDVITVTNLNPLSETTYPIANPNFKIAKVSILSFSYCGAFEFELLVSSLSTTSVKVGIQTANSNLLHLGFQIILGTTEALTPFETKATTSQYTSGGLILKQIVSFFFYILNYNSVTLHHTDQNSSQPLQVLLFNIAWSSSVYAPNTISALQMKYILSYEFKPIQCDTLRISKYLDRKINEKTSKQINLVEENKIYITEGQDSIQVSDTIQTLNVIIYFKCYSNKKVHTVINKCNNCLKQQITLDRNCHGSMNIIYFYMRFTSQSDFKELAITTTTNGFSFDQKLRNYDVQTKNVLNIQMQDI
ncbi:unnamed protein product [Paramecium sonneborni]|uniref:Uncharacterized protein n=1 Tax=Paramecium sonneborni TaxID=65129 RepID=A0A8S1RU13_9CILI|nr:unnamed protein product [Paramecium sonneborni]